MNNNYPNLYKSLIAIGLLDREANLYLALLEMGRRTVSPIARKAGINRTTAYDILNRLANKGLVSVSGKEPTQEYVAENPEKLFSVIEEQIQEKQNQKQILEDLVPQLKSLYNLSDRSKVRFYEGRQGLIEVYEDTLNSTETIRAYASVEDNQKALPGYFPKYYKRRAQKGIAIRAIFPNTEAARELTKHDKEEKRESQLVSTDKFSFSPEINIYDNKIMIASWREKLGIIIESSEIADAMKKIFELAWAKANDFNQQP